MINLYEIISESIKNGKSAALCTITNTQGSTPRKAGSKMLVFPEGNIEGSIGGGALEAECIKNAQQVIANNTSKLYKHALEKDHEMTCGGYVEIFIEPLVTQKKLYIFGGGHVGRALAEIAAKLNFNVSVIDSRKEVLDAYKTITCYNLEIEEAFSTLNFDENTFICTATHQHAGDRKVVSLALKHKFAYLGMIGSKRKVAKTIELLKNRGFSDSEISKIDMPMGVPINCETPQEIAVAVLAKLIDIRNK